MIINWKAKETITKKIKPAIRGNILEEIKKIVGKVPMSIDSLGNLEIGKELTEEEKIKVLALF